MKNIVLIVIATAITSSVFPQERTWQTLAPMPTARYGICSVVYEEKIWIMGGRDENDSTLNIVECYLPRENRWEKNVPSLLIKRFNAAAVVYNNRIYVIGGKDEKDRILNKVEYFDTTEKRWKIQGSLCIAREALTAVVFDSTMYAIGGFSAVETNLGEVEFWNEKEQRWELFNSWKLYQPRVSMATVVVKDAVYTLGGSYFGPLNLVECYRQSKGSVLRQPMQNARFAFAAVVVQDTIYAIGGASIGGSSTNLISVIEKYDPDQDTWAPVKSSFIARDGLTAAVFQDNIYIFGGRIFSYNDIKKAAINFAEMLSFNLRPTVTPMSDNQTPTQFHVMANYPNPFNSQTTIFFQTTRPIYRAIRLEIVNIRGQLIQSYYWNYLPAGEHRVIWNGYTELGENVPSGVYLYQFSVAGYQKYAHKMMLLR